MLCVRIKEVRLYSSLICICVNHDDDLCWSYPTWASNTSERPLRQSSLNKVHHQLARAEVILIGTKIENDQLELSPSLRKKYNENSSTGWYLEERYLSNRDIDHLKNYNMWGFGDQALDLKVKNTGFLTSFMSNYINQAECDISIN